MGQARSAVLDEIARLLGAPPGGEGAPSLEWIEHTLTDGYAHALALEAERDRLQHRIAELAADAATDVGARDRELSTLSTRLRASDGELSRLRGILALLRVRAATMRRASAAPAA